MDEIVLVVIILFLIGNCIYVYIQEKRDFNGGICKVCGSKLHCFGTYSVGARGYTCEHCGKHLYWIFLRIIDKNHKEDQR